MESNSIITATNLSINGIGLTISTASILKRMSQTPINLFPLNSKIMNLKFFLAIKEGKNIPKSLEKLINHFEKLELNTTIK